MKKIMVAGLLALAAAGANEARVYGQFGPQNGGAFAPNQYNRQTQPLSPWLNLTRGGNTAVNYFYGVRPGVMGSGYPQQSGTNQMVGRQTFFPQIDTLYELENTNPADGLRPTGHPFGFNNSLGYFGAGSGMGGSGQRGGMPGQGQGQGAMMKRSGLMSR